MKKNRVTITPKNFFTRRMFLVVLAVILVGGTMFAWQMHERYGLNQLAESTAVHARAQAAETEFRFHSAYHALEHLAAKAPPEDPILANEWTQEASFYLASFDSIDSITWVDNSFEIRQSVPEHVHQARVGQSAQALERHLSEIHIWLPVDHQDQSRGTLLGIIQLESLLSPMIQETSPAYMFQLSDQDQVVFSSDGWQAPHQGLAAFQTITLENTDALGLTLAPTPEQIQSVLTNASRMLWLGLGFSVIAIGSVYLAQNAFHQAFASESHYLQLFTASQDAVFIADQAGAFQDANPAATELVGYTLDELKYMTVEDLVDDRDSFTLSRFSELLTWDSPGWEVLKRKNGQTVVVELTLSPLQFEGQSNTVLGIARDITQRKRTERIQQLRLDLMALSKQGSTTPLLEKTVDEACSLTNSKIGFLHFLDEDQKNLSLQAWSTRTSGEFCQAKGEGLHYPIEEAGVWVDCIHARAPVIHNDYAALPHRKGLPEGHAEVTRELVVPIMRDEKIVAILGVGNKPVDYDQENVETVQHLLDICWDAIEKKRTEVAMAEHQTMQEAIFANAPLLMLLVDDQRQIRQTNDFVAHFTGRAQEEILGLRGGEALRCLHALDTPEGCGYGPHCQGCTIRSTVLDTLENGNTHHLVEAALPLEHLETDQQTTFLLSSSPLILDQTPMALVTLMDISERSQIKQRTEQLLAQQRAVNQLALSLGRDHDLPTIYQAIFSHISSLVNAPAFTIYTYDPPTDAVSVAFSVVDGEIQQTADQPTIALDKDPQACPGRVIHEKRPHYNPGDGEDPPHTCLCIPMIVMGTVIGVIQLKSPQQNAYPPEDRDLLAAIATIAASAIQNASMIDHLEKTIARRTARLEEKILKLDKSQTAIIYMVEDLNQTGAALKAKEQKLVQANKELESFSYSVSHDLRAPLRHINGYIDLLSTRFSGDLPEKARYYLGQVVDAATEMSVLIDSLLEFSRTSRQNMHFTRVDMNDLVNETLVNLQPDLEGRQVDWDIHPLPEVSGDRTLLKLVWVNLLSNAIKFTQKQDPARIEINSYEEPAELIFFVRDNGVGFDMKYSQKLFGVFQRLHAAADYQGTGIGLANLRRIIQRHGGRAWAEGAPGRGATFYFSLPK